MGELEEQLEETNTEHAKREVELRNQVSRLEADVQRFSGEVQSWRLRCDTLDRIAEYERKEKDAALAELAYLRNGARTTGTDAVPLPPRRNRQQERSPAPQQVQYPSETEAEETGGCGNCTSTGRCACIEQAIISTTGCGNCSPDTECKCLEETIKEAANIPSMELKRSHSPSTEQSEKRQRQSDPSTPLEMDFTAQFSSKPIAIPEPTVQIARPPIESCGFCEEGTYCVCAEAAAAAARDEREQENRLAPLLNEVTPPPSDTDVVDGSLTKLPSMHPIQMHRPVAAPPNSCANGPGTCQQCISDPKSGLFCRSLAAMRASATPGSSTPEGCCGGNASGGGCCKSLPKASTSQPPPSLSCADTYKTLSTHKGFEQASDELSTWLGRLHATPPHHAGRAPMEVEAASVMGVLKLFDRRFGRG